MMLAHSSHKLLHPCQPVADYPYCPAEIMWAAMAAPEEPGLQPQPMNNWSSFFFFAAFVLVVAYTLLNLYIGECCCLQATKRISAVCG
jgi:hypothetical protein